MTNDTSTDAQLKGRSYSKDPVAVQSLAATVQATGVRLSPAIDRVKQKTTE